MKYLTWTKYILFISFRSTLKTMYMHDKLENLGRQIRNLDWEVKFFARVTWLVKSRAGIQTQICLILNLMPCFLGTNYYSKNNL